MKGLGSLRRGKSAQNGGARGLAGWFGKGVWAITDQGLFMGSNFVLNVLLARWLLPYDYGAFAVAYAVFALVGVLHTALLLEPMLIYGSGKYDSRLAGYLSTLLYGHAGFGILSSLLLLLGGLCVAFFGDRALSVGLLSLAATSPLILFQWLMRRACYVQLRPHLAALGGAVYMILLLAGAYALYRIGQISTPTAFGLMGFASLIAGLILAARLRVSPRSAGDLAREAIGDHWHYARWATPTKTMVWVVQGGYLLLLPIWGGLEASAAVRAMMNLILPIVQAYSALSILLLPALVRARGSDSFWRISRRSLALFVSGSVGYWLVLGLLQRPLIDWIYGGRYVEYTNLVWLLGLLPIFVGVAEVLSTTLRALERVDQVFWAEVLSAGTALTLGLGALYALGAAGVVIWLLSSAVVNVAVMGWILVKSGRVRGAVPEPERHDRDAESERDSPP